MKAFKMRVDLERDVLFRVNKKYGYHTKLHGLSSQSINVWLESSGNQEIAKLLTEISHLIGVFNVQSHSPDILEANKKYIEYKINEYFS